MQILEEEQRVVVEGFSFTLTKTVSLLKDLLSLSHCRELEFLVLLCSLASSLQWFAYRLKINLQTALCP